MERKESFLEGEFYHIYSRGVEKRTTFLEISDYERFLTLLSLCNSIKSVRVSNLPKQQGFPLLKESEPLVDLLAYALMPNHLHLIIRARDGAGISKFMLKLMTAYSMYFNIKYTRSGPLFTRPFRSKHVDTDEYFRWVLAYTLLNPLDLFQTGWMEHGLNDVSGAAQFLKKYRYASFIDYTGHKRTESAILRPDMMPIDVAALGFDELLRTLADNRSSPIADTTTEALSLV